MEIWILAPGMLERAGPLFPGTATSRIAGPDGFPGGTAILPVGALPTVRIANPIYDVVFKYLLDDEKVARLVLSALVGREILSLQFRPTEVRIEVPRPSAPSLLVLRLDFAATVRGEDGSSRLVLIEIQKAHNPLDVVRFRRYLGGQYASEENVCEDATGRRQALPLVTIYILGEGLADIDVPVLKVNRHYTDAATGEVLPIASPFVEALTHDSIVVQLDRLKGRRRTDLERLLMVFDQDLAEPADPHWLDILEENFPDRYREVLRRLARASADKEVRDGMDVEDDYLATLQDHARKEADLRRVLEEKDQALEEKDQALEEKDKALEEKDKALEAKDKALEARDRVIEALQRRLEEG